MLEHRLPLFVAAIAASIAVPSPSAAQPEPSDPPPPVEAPTPTDPARVRERDPLRADALFQEAIALVDEGRHEEACPKFRLSLAADASVGTLLNVASCSLREGKRLQAAREYRRILEMNTATADPDRKRAIATTARAALEKLAAELASVSFRIVPSQPTAIVVLDGRSTEPLAPGRLAELEPGPHQVVVTAPGFRRLEQRITLKPGKNASVVLSLEPEEAPPRPIQPLPSGPSKLTTAGLVTGLLGGALAAGGGALLAVAADRAAAIRAECGPAAAPPSCPLGSAEVADDLGAEGQAFAISGYVGLGVGGAAIATGVGLLIADAVSPAEVQVVPHATTSEAGLWIVTTF